MQTHKNSHKNKTMEVKEREHDKNTTIKAYLLDAYFEQSCPWDTNTQINQNTINSPILCVFVSLSIQTA